MSNKISTQKEEKSVQYFLQCSPLNSICLLFVMKSEDDERKMIGKKSHFNFLGFFFLSRSHENDDDGVQRVNWISSHRATTHLLVVWSDATLWIYKLELFSFKNQSREYTRARVKKKRRKKSDRNSVYDLNNKILKNEFWLHKIWNYVEHANTPRTWYLLRGKLLDSLWERREFQFNNLLSNAPKNLYMSEKNNFRKIICCDDVKKFNIHSWFFTHAKLSVLAGECEKVRRVKYENPMKALVNRQERYFCRF